MTAFPIDGWSGRRIMTPLGNQAKFVSTCKEHRQPGDIRRDPIHYHRGFWRAILAAIHKAQRCVWKLLLLNRTDPEIAQRLWKTTVVTFSVHGPYARQRGWCIPNSGASEVAQLLVIFVLFALGFGSGYGAREWQSQIRRRRYS